MRFLLLSTNLARDLLQIDTDLLRIITSTADKLFRGTNIDDLERPRTPKIWGLSEFLSSIVLDISVELNFARFGEISSSEKADLGR